MNQNPVIINFIIGLVVLAGLFLILREFMCWYWKQNKIVDLLEQINSKLSGNENKLLEPGSYDTAKVTQTEWICECDTTNPLDKSKKIQNCTNCHRNRDVVLKQALEG